MIPLTVEFAVQCLRALSDESEDRFAREAFECAAEQLEAGHGPHFAEQALGLMGVRPWELPLVWEDLEAS